MPPAPADLRAPLLDWFDAHARDLPWRRAAEPYAVWVSEVMLQQTRVETVLPYYARWLERFPDVEALARASEEEVLKAWEGLGYYRRARSLHRAAAVVRDRHGGVLPGSADALRELPGVGDYTAGAVASIAFGEAVPAVDGNVRRVLARLFDHPAPGAAWLRDTAAELVDPARPGDFNQALMELGATVCSPRSPRCDACPLTKPCASRAAGTVAERPASRSRGAMPERRFGVAVAVARGRPEAEPRVLVVRRSGEGLLGGMWEFPSLHVGEADAEEAARAAARRHGLALAGERVHALPPLRHTYSHFRGVYHPFVVRVEHEDSSREAGRAWADAARLAALPLPRVHRRIAESLRNLI